MTRSGRRGLPAGLIPRRPRRRPEISPRARRVRTARPPPAPGRLTLPAPAGLPFTGRPRSAGARAGTRRCVRAAPDLRGPLEPESTRPGDAPAVPGPVGPRPGAARERWSSTARSASAATARPCSPVPRGPARRPRPGQGGPAPVRRAARALRRARHPRARRLRRAPRGPATGSASRACRASCSTSASPPCSSTRPTAASPTPRTPRSTCAWTRRPASAPPRSSTPTRPANSCGSCGRTARRSRPSGSCPRSCGSASKEPFTNSARLVELIRDALPQAAKRTGGNPAKRTFQALRIEVNGELSVLERAIPAAVKALAVGGRIAVLSYHSLEDRLVKQVFAAGAATTAPPGLPVVPERTSPGSSCSRAVPNFPPRKRSPRTGGPHRRGCAAPSASGRTSSERVSGAGAGRAGRTDGRASE